MIQDVLKRRQYQREWMAKRRAEFFAGKTCAICGSADRLELDHIDSTKKIDHKIWSWSNERRNAELAKCQVLCMKCHKEKHRPEIVHGTSAGYCKFRCRCKMCVAYHSAKTQRWRLKQKEEHSLC